MTKKIIVLDTETTGLTHEDDLLQVSIIGFDKQVLFDEYIKPTNATEWPEAMAVNGITPEMVKDCKTIDERREEIQKIIDEAELIIGYNIFFDLEMLESKGITWRGRGPKRVYDVMETFAEIYGEWNAYYGNYKWQKLSKCADYYGYEWEVDAHNSLGDVYATLYCYKEMEKRGDL